jgi:hypothetical protein
MLLDDADTILGRVLEFVFQRLAEISRIVPRIAGAVASELHQC